MTATAIEVETTQETLFFASFILSRDCFQTMYSLWQVCSQMNLIMASSTIVEDCKEEKRKPEMKNFEIVLEQTMNDYSVQDIFIMAWESPTFYYDYLQSIGETEINITNWTIEETKHTSIDIEETFDAHRTISYIQYVHYIL